MSTRRLLVLLGVLNALSWAGTLLTPVLVHQPLLLAALSPRVPFLALAAHSAPLPLFLLVGGVRLAIGDPVHYELGRRHGSSRIPVRLRRIVERAGLYAVVLRPISYVLATAGAAEVCRKRVAVADVVGTAGYLLLLRGGASLF